MNWAAVRFLAGVLLTANSMVRAVAGVELLVYADDVDARYLVIGVGDGVAERVESGTGVAGVRQQVAAAAVGAPAALWHEKQNWSIRV